jgi:hypothetical protein
MVSSRNASSGLERFLDRTSKQGRDTEIGRKNSNTNNIEKRGATF